MKASPLYAKYAEAVDRESAREKLAAKLDAGAEKAKAEQQAEQQAKKVPVPKPKGRAPRPEKSVVEEVLTSTTARQMGRTAVREIFRGLFKTGRR